MRSVAPLLLIFQIAIWQIFNKNKIFLDNNTP
jgi:hypothetical protein